MLEAVARPRRRARDDAAAPALEERRARAPVQVRHGAGRTDAIFDYQFTSADEFE